MKENRKELIEQLEKLHSLKERGVINEVEFNKQKELILKDLESDSIVEKTQEKKEGVFPKQRDNGNEVSRFLKKYRKQIIYCVCFFSIIFWLTDVVKFLNNYLRLGDSFSESLETHFHFSLETLFLKEIFGALIFILSLVQMGRMRKSGLYLNLFAWGFMIFLASINFNNEVNFYSSSMMAPTISSSHSWHWIIYLAPYIIYLYYWKYFLPKKGKPEVENILSETKIPAFKLNNSNAESKNQEILKIEEQSIQAITTNFKAKKPKKVSAKRAVLIICCIIFIPLISFFGYTYFFDGSGKNTDEKAIENLVYSWNRYLNNWNSIDSLKYIYADSIGYDKKTDNNSYVEWIKWGLGEDGPAHQYIISEINLKKLSEDKYNCNFILRFDSLINYGEEGLQFVNRNSYVNLVFSRNNDNWNIISEKDSLTQTNLPNENDIKSNSNTENQNSKNYQNQQEIKGEVKIYWNHSHTKWQSYYDEEHQDEEIVGMPENEK